MYHFIINPHSCTGKGLSIWRKVETELARLSVPYKSYLTTYPGHGRELATSICQENTGIIKLVILGGDGTINEVFNGIPDISKVELGYIPSGSSNDFGRSMGLSKDPLENLSSILKSTGIRKMDYGLITNRNNKLHNRFLVSAGVGYDASVCRVALRSNLKKYLNAIKLGKLTYILLAIRQLLAWPLMEGEVSVDGKPFLPYTKLLLVTSMIQKYEGGGMKMAPKADPNDGLLSVCLVHGLSKYRLLFLLPTLLIGKHTGFKGVEAFNCSELVIRFKTPQVLHCDGECPGDYKELKVTCRQNEVQLLQ